MANAAEGDGIAVRRNRVALEHGTEVSPKKVIVVQIGEKIPTIVGCD
jgi:hypothetical protein